MAQDPKREGDFVILYSPSGELFRCPTATDYNHYLRKGYTTTAPERAAKVQPSAPAKKKA